MLELWIQTKIRIFNIISLLFYNSNTQLRNEREEFVVNMFVWFMKVGWGIRKNEPLIKCLYWDDKATMPQLSDYEIWDWGSRKLVDFNHKQALVSNSREEDK